MKGITGSGSIRKALAVLLVAAVALFGACSNPAGGGDTKETVKTPAFSVAGGSYNAPQSVSITCPTSGAAIFYSTDGNPPSTPYSSAVAINATATLKAIAKKSGMTDSNVATAIYTISIPPGTVETPQISLPSGTYVGTQSVSITCATANASIYYSLDNSTPSLAYSAAISVTSSSTLKAIAKKVGMTDSAMATATYTINPPIISHNIAISILDSVAGSLVATPDATLKVYANGTLAKTSAISTNPATVSIPEGTYRMTLDVTGRASDAKENVVVAADGSLYFISQPTGMSSFASYPPSISSLSYTTDATPTAGGSWTQVSSGDTMDIASVKGFKVTTTSTSTMDATSWSGFGIKLDIDNVPTTFKGLVPDTLTNTFNAGTGLFTATAVFASSVSVSQILPGAHSFGIVVYDRGNNRSELALPVTFTSTISAAADISGDQFLSFLVDLRGYGLTREYFGKGPVASVNAFSPLSTGGTTYRVAISFKFADKAATPANVPILGFTVERSSDGGTSWITAGTVNYGAFGTGVSGVHTFYDNDPSLVVGTPYTYRATAFTGTAANNKFTLGVPVTATFLPTFTSSLASPAHGSTGVTFDNATGAGPDYAYTISDPSLWSSNKSDYYYFAPLIREKDGTLSFYGQFRYRFSTNALQFSYNGGWLDTVSNFGGAIGDYITFSSGTITLKASIFALGYDNLLSGAPIAYKSGVTYEWDIFGTNSGGNLGSSSTMTASYFQKGLSTTAGGLSRSYADVYQNGQQTLNGWFEFTTN